MILQAFVSVRVLGLYVFNIILEENGRYLKGKTRKHSTITVNIISSGILKDLIFLEVSILRFFSELFEFMVGLPDLGYLKLILPFDFVSDCYGYRG